MLLSMLLLCLLLLLLLLQHSLLLILLGLLGLLLSHLHLLLREVRRKLNGANLLLIALESLLILLSLHQLRQLLSAHVCNLLRGYPHLSSVLHHSLAHDILLLLLNLSHHWIVAGLLERLLLEELLLLLRGHVVYGVHATLCARHVLRAHALARHSHRSAWMLTTHTCHSICARLHASHGARLHAHHGTRLANVRRT